MAKMQSNIVEKKQSKYRVRNHDMLQISEGCTARRWKFLGYHERGPLVVVVVVVIYM